MAGGGFCPASYLYLLTPDGIRLEMQDIFYFLTFPSMTQIMPRVPLYLLINAGEWADDTPEGEEPKTKK